jgi:hypothetical protein
VQPLQPLNLDGKKFSLLGDLDEAMNSVGGLHPFLFEKSE